MSPELRSAGIKDVTFGRDVTVILPSNLYGCEIGDECFIGPFVEIQRGVRIGNRCKIQSHSFICELVSIADDCFVGHGVMFTNDPFQDGGPARGDRAKWKETVIERCVSIGSNTTLLPVHICPNVVIGAGAVVTRDITEAGVYAGVPAKLIRRF